MQRLATRPQFQAVLAGTLVAKTTHFALHRLALDALALFPVQDAWMGAMVPKRLAKRAVTRNTIKRQIYAVSADFSQQYPLAAFVVRLRRGFSRAEFISASSAKLKLAVREEVTLLLQSGVNAA